MGQLLKSGLDPNYRVTDNEIAWTPLFLAARGCHLETVQVLLKHGAEVNAKSQSDQTPLHAVIWNKTTLLGMNGVVHALLEAGAVVNARNSKGQTPLHWAAHYGHVEAVRLLVKYGADTRLRNDDGETALDKALGAGNPKRAAAARQIAQILQRGGEAPQLSVLSHLWGKLPTMKTMHTWHLSVISSIRSVHEGKMYYTFLRKLVATKVCGLTDAQGWLEKALDRLSDTLKNKGLELSFRLLLDKAVEDGMIAAQTIELMPGVNRGDADSTITSEGPEEPSSFCQFVKHAAHPDNFRFEHLDGSTQALQNAMGLLFQKMMVLNLDERELLFDTESRSSISLEKKQRLEIHMQALVSMLRGVLNVILRGAESDKETWHMERICARIVDYGDVEHIKECIAEEPCDESKVFLKSFSNGVQLARDVAENVEDESTGKRLDNVFDRKDPFLVLGMISAMAQPDYGKIDDEHFENFQKAMKKTAAPTIKERDESPGAETGSTGSPWSDTRAESFSSHDHSYRRDSLSSHDSPDHPTSDNIGAGSSHDGRRSQSTARMSPISETDVKTYTMAPKEQDDRSRGSQYVHVAPPSPSGKGQRCIKRGTSSTSSGSWSMVSSLASNQNNSADSNFTGTTSGSEEKPTLPAKGDAVTLPIEGPIRESFNVSPANARAVLKASARQKTPPPPPELQTDTPPSLPPPAFLPKAQPRSATVPRPPVVPNVSSSVLREIYPDARLCQEDEDELVLHAAVKFGDIDLLNECLDEVSEEEINATDSCGRTAMDLAALTGQIELLKMLEEKGGKFAFKRHGLMLATARLRSLNVTQYLKLVDEEV